MPIATSLDMMLRPSEWNMTCRDHVSTARQRHNTILQDLSPETRVLTTTKEPPEPSSSSLRCRIIPNGSSCTAPLANHARATDRNGCDRGHKTTSRPRRRNTMADMSDIRSQNWPYLSNSFDLTQPAPVFNAASASPSSSIIQTSANESVAFSNESCPAPVPIRRRGLHKKPRSYDLRDDFANDEPAARAALEVFHSRLAVPVVTMSETQGGPGQLHDARLTCPSPQLHRHRSFEQRPESKSTRSWPSKGGQLLH